MRISRFDQNARAYGHWGYMLTVCVQFMERTGCLVQTSSSLLSWRILSCRRSRSRSFALDGTPNLKVVVMSRYSAFFNKNGLTSPALTSICG